MQRILQEIMKKNNTWNIRRLVEESFVPVNQQTIVLYCRLSDFRICPEHSEQLIETIFANNFTRNFEKK